LTDNRNTPSTPNDRPARRSLLSARKLALMATVVAGLGGGVYGLGASANSFSLFTTPAHAQVNNDVSKVAQPTGFADIAAAEASHHGGHQGELACGEQRTTRRPVVGS
jgi:serine protease Do